MKLSKTQIKKIQNEVDKYIVSLAVWEEKGTKKILIDNGLRNEHDALLDFYKQDFFLAYPTDNERFIAKQYFKSKLPYKEWREAIANTPYKLATEIEDFEERYNPNYVKKRRTPRGRNVS